MQGKLRNASLSVAIETECVHCYRAIHFDIDNELKYRVEELAASPLIFIPLVNIGKLKESSIIDAL